MNYLYLIRLIRNWLNSFKPVRWLIIQQGAAARRSSVSISSSEAFLFCEQWRNFNFTVLEEFLLSKFSNNFRVTVLQCPHCSVLSGILSPFLSFLIKLFRCLRLCYGFRPRDLPHVAVFGSLSLSLSLGLTVRLFKYFGKAESLLTCSALLLVRILPMIFKTFFK